jgi:hypothetical protein
MTNEERARRWIDDTHLSQCVVDSEVRTLVTLLDEVRQKALEDASDLIEARLVALEPNDSDANDETHGRVMELRHMRRLIEAR